MKINSEKLQYDTLHNQTEPSVDHTVQANSGPPKKHVFFIHMKKDQLLIKYSMLNFVVVPCENCNKVICKKKWPQLDLPGNTLLNMSAEW